jgi:hypothetical protein
LHSLCSGAKACRIPIDGLGDLVRKIFPHQVVSAVPAASDPPSGFRGSWKYLCGAIFSARLSWRGSESRAAGNLLAHHAYKIRTQIRAGYGWRKVLDELTNAERPRLNRMQVESDDSS